MNRIKEKKIHITIHRIDVAVVIPGNEAKKETRESTYETLKRDSAKKHHAKKVALPYIIS